jgi:hypothetical protein
MTAKENVLKKYPFTVCKKIRDAAPSIEEHCETCGQPIKESTSATRSPFYGCFHVLMRHERTAPAQRIAIARTAAAAWVKAWQHIEEKAPQ